MPDMENWKAVPGYEGFYEISDLGRVRRITVIGESIGKILLPDITKGYSRVTLCRDNVHDRRQVHHLVMEAFVGPRPKGMEVNHKRGVINGNALDNLEYVTRRQNALHAYGVLGKKSQQGSQHGRSKITEEIARAIFQARQECKSLNDISAKFGVCIATVSMIANKKIWKHIH
jgi:hypothetical protein